MEKGVQEVELEMLANRLRLIIESAELIETAAALFGSRDLAVEIWQ